MLKNSFRQLLEISLMISPLITLIILLKKSVLLRLGPASRLLLWVPLLIQLIIPVSLQSRRSLYQPVVDEVQLNLFISESLSSEIPDEEMPGEYEIYTETVSQNAPGKMQSAVSGIAVI